MVTSLLIFTLTASACVEAGVLQQRQSNWAGPGGKVTNPLNTTPCKQILKSILTIPGVQNIKIR